MVALLTKSRVFNLFVVIGNNGSSDGKYFYTLMNEVYEKKECSTAYPPTFYVRELSKSIYLSL